MIQLLPAVCRDCGRGGDEGPLSPYLDFELCATCIARREREVCNVEGRRALASAKQNQSVKGRASSGPRVRGPERAGARWLTKKAATPSKKPARKRRAAKSRPKR